MGLKVSERQSLTGSSEVSPVGSVGQAVGTSATASVIGVVGTGLNTITGDQMSSVEGTRSSQVETLVGVARDGSTSLAVGRHVSEETVGFNSVLIKWEQRLRELEARAVEQEYEVQQQRMECEQRWRAVTEEQHVATDRAKVFEKNEGARRSMAALEGMERRFPRRVTRVGHLVRLGDFQDRLDRVEEYMRALIIGVQKVDGVGPDREQAQVIGGDLEGVVGQLEDEVGALRGIDVVEMVSAVCLEQEVKVLRAESVNQHEEQHKESLEIGENLEGEVD